MPVLATKEILKKFGGLKAVDNFFIEVEQGAIAGLIGPNGAGKTTLFNVISGFYKPDRGEVVFKDKRIDGLSPWQISRKGLTRTFQIARGLKGMSVMENMLVAPRDQLGENPVRAILNDSKVKGEESKYIDKANGLLKKCGLFNRRNDYAGDLSVGETKTLEVTRALMTDPEVLLLDEPTAGTTVRDTQTIMDYIRELREDKGLTFLIVEHKMEVIMNMCEWIVVMVNGQRFADGTPEEIQANEGVREIYLGKKDFT